MSTKLEPRYIEFKSQDEINKTRQAKIDAKLNLGRQKVRKIVEENYQRIIKYK